MAISIPSRPMGRRQVLRGLGGIAVALPMMDAMRPRVARAAPGAPKRFVVVFNPHGPYAISMPKWRPQGTGTSYQLSELMMPLAPHRDDITVLSGVDMTSARNQGGNGHTKGASHALTATRSLSSSATGDVFENGDNFGYGGGISIDQEIANHIATQAEIKFRSLHFGVQSGPQFAVRGVTPRSRIAYRDAGKPIPNEDNPAAMFDRLFKDLTGGPNLDRLRAERRSVLDFVRQDFERLNPTLGSADRARLDEHLSTIREIERGLDLGTGGLGACAAPDIPNLVSNHNQNDKFPAVGAQQMKMLVMALACDLTRVATFMWSTSQSMTIHRWAGVDKGHHGFTHNGNGTAPQNEAINTWYSARMAELLTQMKAVNEGDGSLLDHTAVLWLASEMGRPDTHGFGDVPYVVAGGCGGALRTGQHVQYQNRSNNDLFVTMMKAMDLPGNSFGDPKWVTGPMSELLA